MFTKWDDWLPQHLALPHQLSGKKLCFKTNTKNKRKKLQYQEQEMRGMEPTLRSGKHGKTAKMP